MEDSIERADQALLLAKTAGRNRAMSWVRDACRDRHATAAPADRGCAGIERCGSTQTEERKHGNDDDDGADDVDEPVHMSSLRVGYRRESIGPLNLCAHDKRIYRGHRIRTVARIEFLAVEPCAGATSECDPSDSEYCEPHHGDARDADAPDRRDELEQAGHGVLV